MHFDLVFFKRQTAKHSGSSKEGSKCIQAKQAKYYNQGAIKTCCLLKKETWLERGHSNWDKKPQRIYGMLVKRHYERSYEVKMKSESYHHNYDIMIFLKTKSDVA